MSSQSVGNKVIGFSLQPISCFPAYQFYFRILFQCLLKTFLALDCSTVPQKTLEGEHLPLSTNGVKKNLGRIITRSPVIKRDMANPVFVIVHPYIIRFVLEGQEIYFTLFQLIGNGHRVSGLVGVNAEYQISLGTGHQSL